MGRKKGRRLKFEIKRVFKNKKGKFGKKKEFWKKRGNLVTQGEDFILKGEKEDCRTFGTVQN